MLRALRDEGVLPFTDVVADGLYGHSPDFREAGAAAASPISCVSLPADPRCWLQGPGMQTQQSRDTGERRTKRVVPTLEQTPRAVETFAKSLHPGFWSRRKVAEGPNGPIADDFTTRQVPLCPGGRPTQTVWLVVKRTLGATPSSWYHIRNAPVSLRVPRLVWFRGRRWAIEPCFEAAKTARGLDQSEVRTYPGWQHHLLATMLAHFFLWPLQRRLGEKSAGPDGLPAANLAGGGLAPQPLDA